MMSISLLRACGGEGLFNQFGTGKVDVGGALEPWDGRWCWGRWVQGTQMGHPLLFLPFLPSWSLRRGFPPADPSPHGLIYPHPIPAGVVLRCACPAPGLPAAQKQGVFRHLSMCFLKTCGGTLKGATVRMKPSKAFRIPQLNEM